MPRTFKITTLRAPFYGSGFAWVIVGKGKRAASLFYNHATREEAIAAAFAALPDFDLIAE